MDVIAKNCAKPQKKYKLPLRVENEDLTIRFDVKRRMPASRTLASMYASMFKLS
jgi:hypothetical protein